MEKWKKLLMITIRRQVMTEKQKKPTRTGINPSFYHNEQPHNFAV